MKTLREYNLKNKAKLYFIPLKKFKTLTLSVFIHTQLNRENATKNALLPNVLRRGCKGFPTYQEIQQYLQELYGTTFNCGISKKGEDQIIRFDFEMISDKYVPDNISLFKQVLSLVKNIIFYPIVENNSFKKEYVEQEKIKLKEKIESLINDKVSYAVERCFEEMCKNEKFGTYELGYIKDLDFIDEKNLYSHYKKILNLAHIDIFVTGDFDENKLYNTVSTIFDIDMLFKEEYPKTEIISSVSEKKDVKEELDIKQGKLSLGFRTKCSPNDNEYYSLIVYNSILGGGAHSKLFNNVREKLSLSYYIFSRLDKFKGLMIISSGIEINNYDKAFKEIVKQMQEIKNGNISEYEYQASIGSIINTIKSTNDSAFYLVDYYLGQLIAGTDDDIEDLIDKILNVSINDVVSVAKDIELDTIYFLKNKNK